MRFHILNFLNTDLLSFSFSSRKRKKEKEVKMTENLMNKMKTQKEVEEVK